MSARAAYCRILMWLPIVAFLCVGIVNILAGTSNEWGYLGSVR